MVPTVISKYVSLYDPWATRMKLCSGIWNMTHVHQVEASEVLVAVVVVLDCQPIANYKVGLVARTSPITRRYS